MLSLLLALRAVRWRAAASATVFVVALIAVLAATVGPIYLHAADQTVLRERLGHAAQSSRDLMISQSTVPGVTDDSDTRSYDWTDRVRSTTGAAADPRWFAPPVYADRAEISFAARVRYAGQLATIDGACAHLHVLSGRCVAADSASETMISRRMAAVTHLGVGDTVTVAPTPTYGKPFPLRIVGVYQPVAPGGTFWSPWGFFAYGQPSAGDAPPKADAFVVGPRALSSRFEVLAQTLGANLRLRPDRVRLDDVPALKAHLAAAARYTSTHPAPSGVPTTGISAGLRPLLDSMSHEMSLTRTLITVSTVQLALLALIVLYAVVAGTTSAQGPEIALAKLRGRPRAATVAQGVLPPVLLVVLATPLGALLAWVVVRLLAPSLLGGSAAVTFPAVALAVAALAAGAGVLAAVVAAHRILTAPVAALLHRGGDSSGSRLGLALLDAAAVTLAVAGLIELLAGGVLDSGHTDPLSALAPTLLAVAGAVVVLRLLPFAGRALVRATRDSGRLAMFLAVRQLVRRPAGARSLLLVAIALALAGFALVNWSVARTNRHDRALNSAGAATVLTVKPKADVDLRTSVDHADPGGHSMAAAYVPNPGSTDLLAVETSRFARVGAWVGGNAHEPLAKVLRALVAGSRPSVTFTGDRLRLAVDLTAHPAHRVTVTVDVVDAGHEETAYTFGPIRPGSHDYTKVLGAPCPSACRVTGLALASDTPQQVEPGIKAQSLAATITAQAGTAGGWRPIAGFGAPRSWHSDGASVSTLTSAGTGLSVDLRQSEPGGNWAALRSTDLPASLPAVVASGTAHVYPGDTIHHISTAGLDANTLPVNGVVSAVTIPQLDRTGVMIDFGSAQRAQSGVPGSDTRYQVWLAPGAPKDMIARLARQGVRVTGIVRAAGYQRSLDDAGPAFAAGLFLVAAVAAVVLAAGATVLAGVLTARRRGYEFAALEVVGVAPRTLRRATAAEQATVLGLGLVVGLAAGIGGAALALPSTPFFVNESIGPPRVNTLPWGVIGLLVAGLVVVFLVTDLAVAALMSRQARVGRLRESQA